MKRLLFVISVTVLLTFVSCTANKQEPSEPSADSTVTVQVDTTAQPAVDSTSSVN